jgi:hypothetical protein
MVAALSCTPAPAHGAWMLTPALAWLAFPTLLNA